MCMYIKTKCETYVIKFELPSFVYLFKCDYVIFVLMQVFPPTLTVIARGAIILLHTSIWPYSISIILLSLTHLLANSCHSACS